MIAFPVQASHQGAGAKMDKNTALGEKTKAQFPSSSSNFCFAMTILW